MYNVFCKTCYSLLYTISCMNFSIDLRKSLFFSMFWSWKGRDVCLWWYTLYDIRTWDVILLGSDPGLCSCHLATEDGKVTSVQYAFDAFLRRHEYTLPPGTIWLVNQHSGICKRWRWQELLGSDCCPTLTQLPHSFTFTFTHSGSLKHSHTPNHSFIPAHSLIQSFTL